MPGRLNWKMWQTDFFFFLLAGIPFIYSGSGSKSNAGGQAVKKGYIFSIFALRDTLSTTPISMSNIHSDEPP